MSEDRHVEASQLQLVGRPQRNLVDAVVAVEIRAAVGSVPVEGKRAAQPDIHDPVLVAKDAVLRIDIGRVTVVSIDGQIAPGEDRRPVEAQRHLELRVEVVGHAQIEEVSRRVFVVVEDVLAEGQGRRVVEDVPHGHRKARYRIGDIVVELLVVTRKVGAAPQAHLQFVVQQSDVQVGSQNDSVGHLLAAPQVHVLEGPVQVHAGGLSEGRSRQQQRRAKRCKMFQGLHGSSRFEVSSSRSRNRAPRQGIRR